MELVIRYNGNKTSLIVGEEGCGVNDVSMHAQTFGPKCNLWSSYEEESLLALKCVKNFMNDMLRVRGHLFLNEVYDKLGMPRTAAGAVVGWIYSTENATGNNHVEFDIRLKENGEFIVDFNVDGCILDKI